MNGRKSWRDNSRGVCGIWCFPQNDVCSVVAMHNYHAIVLHFASQTGIRWHVYKRRRFCITPLCIFSICFPFSLSLNASRQWPELLWAVYSTGGSAGNSEKAMLPFHLFFSSSCLWFFELVAVNWPFLLNWFDLFWKYFEDFLIHFPAIHEFPKSEVHLSFLWFIQFHLPVVDETLKNVPIHVQLNGTASLIVIKVTENLSTEIKKYPPVLNSQYRKV